MGLEFPKLDTQKLRQAIGKVTRVVHPNSAIINGCFGGCYDWHQSAIYKVEVWWQWANGESALADHNPRELEKIVKRKHESTRQKSFG